MKTTSKNKVTSLATFGVLLIVSQLLYAIGLFLKEKCHSSDDLLVFIASVSYTIHFSVFTLWFSSLNKQIADTYIKKSLLCLNLLTVSSLLVTICKNALLTDTEFAAKHLLRYACFIPIILIPCFLIILIKRINLFKTKSSLTIQATFLAITAVFLVIRCVFPANYALSVISHLVTLLFIESCICSGFIPTVSDYTNLLNNSTLKIQITDNNYEPLYISSKAAPFPTHLIKSSNNGVIASGNTLLHDKPISAGHVLWSEDITKLNSLIDCLQDAQEQIGEENTLLQAELELKSARAQADEKSRLYDRIAKEVEIQLSMIDELLSLADSHPEKTDSIMAKVCILGSYVKRRGNLLLLREDNSRLQTRELEYCIRESLDNLRLSGVYTAFDSFCEDKMLTNHIIAVYDFYESLVELLHDNINAMMVNLRCKSNSLRLNIQIGCNVNIPKNKIEEIDFTCGTLEYSIEDQDAIINLIITDGGNENA